MTTRQFARRNFLKGGLALAARPVSAAIPASRGDSYDVIVVGATSAGTGSAITAGRHGLRVALIEETPTLGGLLSNGLSNTDLLSPGGSSGLFEEFRLRSCKYYTENFPDDPAMKTVKMAQLGFRYEPHVADKIFKDMVAEIPSIHVFYNRYAVKALKSGNRVTGVVTHDPNGANELVFQAPITIDATHEGDLLPLAGAAFRLGREPRSGEEPHAGAIYMTHDGEVFGSGQGDNKLQAYAMLITIKDYGPGADKTIPQPPGYDPKNYAPEPKDQTFWFNGGVLPNRKYEVNENFDGTDATVFQQNYITGGRAERRRVWEKYRDYTLGYLYFRQTVMGEKYIGLADDEYPDNNHLPYILYVREGRRLEGMHVYNERDAIRVPGYLRPPLQKDSIAVGDWKIDAHANERNTEGYIYLGAADPFKISAPIQAPYGILVPKVVDGLLVPMAVSSTHVGFQVLRLEAIRMAMGQAAGNAAALCVKQRIQPRHVSVPQLQAMLLDQNQSIYYYQDVIPSTPFFQAIQRLSLAGAIHGYNDFTFRPEKDASRGDLAKLIFNVLHLDVKMDYTDLWKIMGWDKRPATKQRGRQNCTPEHWATYYLMTLYNYDAFNEEFLRNLDPDSSTTRHEMAHWTAAALGVPIESKALLKTEVAKPDGPITRSELCSLLEQVRA